MNGFACMVRTADVRLLRQAVVGLLVLAFIIGGAVTLSHPLGRWMRRSEGFVIIARTAVEHVRIDRPGDSAVVNFVLDNVTDRPVIISAAETSCNCTTLEGLPITIPANGESTLRFRLDTTHTDSGRSVNTTIKLLLDTPSPVVGLVIAAEIGEANVRDVKSSPRTVQDH